MTIEAPTPTEIKELREGMKMTQERFAAWLGISRYTVTFWETGHRHPSGASKKLLSEKLREVRSKSRN